MLTAGACARHRIPTPSNAVYPEFTVLQPSGCPCLLSPAKCSRRRESAFALPSREPTPANASDVWRFKTLVAGYDRLFLGAVVRINPQYLAAGGALGRILQHIPACGTMLQAAHAYWSSGIVSTRRNWDAPLFLPVCSEAPIPWTIRRSSAIPLSV